MTTILWVLVAVVGIPLLMILTATTLRMIFRAWFQEKERHLKNLINVSALSEVDEFKHKRQVH